MDASNRNAIPPANAESSFGIKKIVDCKLSQDGKQMYKVQWEATWEPFENLASCQHLIDEFWSFVNKAKAIENVSQQHRKRPRLDSDLNHQNNSMGMDMNMDQHRLTEDSKADVQRLIARTNTTQPGNGTNFMTPSEMLNYPQSNQNQMGGMPSTPTRNNQNFMAQSPHMQQNIRQDMPPQSPNQMNNKKPNFNSPQQNFGSPQQGFGTPPGQRGKGGFGNKGMKAETDEAKTKQQSSINTLKSFSTSDLKYIETFCNPYVKITLSCKICNKEQSMKHQATWKRHYLTHASNEEKPFKCELCGKAFVQKTAYRSHLKTRHGNKSQEDGLQNLHSFVVKQEIEMDPLM